MHGIVHSKRANAMDEAAREHVLTNVSQFFADPLPDACDAIAYRLELARQNNTQLSGFERYAARVLQQAGAEKVRAIMSHHAVSMGRLTATLMAWLRFDEAELSDDEVRTLLLVESVVNRLTLLAINQEDLHSYSYLDSNEGEGFALNEDWRILHSVAEDAAAAFNEASEPNPLLTLRDTTAMVGGEWDLRTRFASKLESLPFPYRLTYRFDCDAATGVFSISMLEVDERIFPDFTWDATLGQWLDANGLRGWEASAYNIRVAALLAACAFGCGMGVTRVVVNVFRGQVDGACVGSLEFSRMPFKLIALPLIQSDEFSSSAMSARIMLQKLGLSAFHVSFAADGLMQETTPLDAALPERNEHVWADERTIPAPLRTPLHADQVRDLDISLEHDPALANQVMEAINELKEFPMASQLTLEQAVGDLSPRPRGGSRELYFSDPIARLLMCIKDPTETRYGKYSDARFAALSKLSDLYQEAGDFDSALKMANAMVEHGPTSSTGYLDCATVLIQKHQFQDACEKLTDYLWVANEPRIINYSYYRLAYALYLSGRIEESIAAYVLVIANNGNMASQALAELRDVLERSESKEPPTPDAARAILQRANIPLAPTDDVLNAVARFAVELTDAGLFNVARPLVLSAAREGSQDVLASVAQSLS